MCICRLTLGWISSEISIKLLGMPTHLDRSSFTTAGLSLMPTGHFCCPLSTPSATLRRPSPTAFSEFLFPTPTGVPLPTSGRSEISSTKPFVCFRAKTDKGIICLADHLHSVTFQKMWTLKKDSERDRES